MAIQRWTTGIGLVVILTTMVQAQTAKPAISGLANFASNLAGPAAPGEMVVLTGSGLGPVQPVNAQLDSNGNLLSTLSNVQVLFDGNPAPLISVSATQVVAVVPSGVTGQTTTAVQVTFNGVASDPLTNAVSATAPAIFSIDGTGKGQGSISNIDGSPNSTSNPVMPGSYITFRITGHGLTNPTVADGVIQSTLAVIVAPVSVSVAGEAAQVLYTQSTPGFVNGVAFVTVQVPSDLTSGGNLPLMVQVGDASSQAGITVAIAGPPLPTPGTPISITATAVPPNQIQVSWTAADALAARFHIERQAGGSGNFIEVSVVDGSKVSFTDSGLVPGTSYQYRVRAENNAGFSQFSIAVTASLVIPQVAPPSNVQAIAVSQTQINLTWAAPNTNATSFQIERKTGTTGTYSKLATVLSTTTTYPDTTVSANTTYVYRIQSQGASGSSGYSSEATVTTPALPLPPAPSLTVAVISSSQVHLSWTSVATGVIRFRIERRTSTVQYAEINQPGPTATTLDDSALTGSMTYFYRIRVETGAGISASSNEVTATTLQAPPIAPTNLKATAPSATQVTLTWTNNAADATAIRVEVHTTGATYSDIGAAATLTGTSIINIQPGTTYTFRVRAQNAAGYSGYSNEATVLTPVQLTTVFLLHGIAQGARNMQSLKQTLESGLDGHKYVVDATFDYSSCATNPFCTAPCSISDGASKLATKILGSTAPGSKVMLVGYSMGGLIARDMILNNYGGIAMSRKITALVTLGTPNLGYPYGSLDSLLGPFVNSSCPILSQQMASDFRSQESNRTVSLSPYLSDLTNRWTNMNASAGASYWLAASGGYCKSPIRTGDITSSLGCPDYNKTSDGVVCDQSARYNYTGANTPTQTWYGDAYAHASGVIMCGFSSGNSPLLFDPAPGDDLSRVLWNTVGTR